MAEIALFVLMIVSLIVAAAAYTTQKYMVKSHDELTRLAASVRLCETYLRELAKRQPPTS